MVNRVTIELSLGDEPGLISPIDGVPIKVLLGSRKTFTFELCRKEARMGDVHFSQFWMDRPSVSGRGRRAARNRAPILDFGWWYAMQNMAIFEQGYQKSLILGHLFQHTRLHGAARIVANSVLTSPFRRGARNEEVVNALDKELAEHRMREMGVCDFRDETAKFLGPGEFSAEVWEKYEEFERQLLDEGCGAIQRDGINGLRETIKYWKKLMSTIARRHGHEIEKQALDILSHESSAALNRLYTITWSAIIPRLAELYDLSDQAITFHKFWHMEQCAESAIPGELFHAFHGLVLSLHPAAATFLSTMTGPVIMAEWLGAPQDIRAYQRLLFGLFVAITNYARQRDIAKELRTRDAGFITNFDVEAEEEPQSSDDPSSADIDDNDS